MQRIGARLTAIAALLALLVAVVPVSAGALPPLPVAPTAYGDGAGLPTPGPSFPGGAVEDFFGEEVAVAGKLAVVGSPSRDSGGFTSAGRATLFERSTSSGWISRGDLDAGPYGNYNEIGSGVAISGTTAVVGSNANRVYLFDTSTSPPTLATTLVGPDGGMFGNAVAADAQTIVVGALTVPVGGVSSGAAYVYTRTASGWSEPVKIVPPAPQTDQWFGTAVAVDGDDIIVGSYNYNAGAGAGDGRAYAYRRSGTAWNHVGTFSLATPAGDYLGYSVAVSDGTAVIGAPRHSQGAGPANVIGAAFVYRWNGSAWTSLGEVTSPWAAPNDSEEVGISVAVRGDTVLALAPAGRTAETPTFPVTGAFYQYRIESGGLTFVRAMSGAGAGVTDFSSSLAWDGVTALVGGAEMDGPLGVDYGRIWFFGLTEFRPRANSTLTVAAPGVLGNDQANGFITTAALITGPAHGSLVLNADGSFSYTPAIGYVGADSFQYMASNAGGMSFATVNLTVVAPSPKTPSAITIRTDKTSVYRYKTFILSGLLTKGAYLDPCVVWVRKPGLARWSYSSARLCYRGNADGTANWWYRYLPKVRGKFAFKVSFQGDASRASVYSPNIVYVTVR